MFYNILSLGHCTLNSKVSKSVEIVDAVNSKFLFLMLSFKELKLEETKKCSDDGNWIKGKLCRNMKHAFSNNTFYFHDS